jgi:bifunctional oligoribonuclease and PAP phosphatase NrnA
MRSVPPELLDFIDRHGPFYVIGHKEPDGDCVGSQLALASFLKRSGRSAYLLSAGPFTRTEIMQYEGRFSLEAPPEKPSERAAAIVLDCSSLQRIGAIVQTLPKVPIAFIDHHAGGNAVGDVTYIDDTAPSVTLMVLRLIEAMGGSPNKEEAELLLFGLGTDTGFFRHLDESSEESFLATARLVSAGASPKRVYNLMSGGKSIASRKLMGEILTRMEAEYGGALLVSFATLQDQQRYGLASRDSDMLYQLLLSIAGCEAAMVIRQESEAECTVGLRARDRIDVGSIAASFGGGGHRLAAGLLMRGKPEEVKAKLVAAFKPWF